VLDVPVGTGRLLGFLRGADTVVGIDVSAEMLAKAREVQRSHGMHQVELIKGDAISTGFRDAEFDTIFCFRLVHLLPPDVVPLLLAELSRICRGRVLLQLYSSASPGRRPLWRGIAQKAAELIRTTKRPEPTPWSHIQSFAHTTAFVDDCVAVAGLNLLGRHRLADYHGSRVEVLELAT
jgi:ubiquinone/menaquinone biosynthesis C-methylase UbiE